MAEGVRILTKNGIENTNIDGARDYNFNAGNRDGIVKGVLKEGALSKPSSNTISLSPCELRISGHRVVIESTQYQTFSSSPESPIRYALIGRITMVDSNPSFFLITQSAETPLKKNRINEGDGIYEVEIGRFTLSPDGTISDITRTLNVITGGIEGGSGGGLEVGIVETKTLSPNLDAEVDVKNRYDEEKGKTVTDFIFGIPRGEPIDIVQSTGLNEGKVMSQAAVTQAIQTLNETLNSKVDNTVNKFKKIVQGEKKLLPGESLYVEPNTLYMVQCFDNYDEIQSLELIGGGNYSGKAALAIVGDRADSQTIWSRVILQTGSIIINDLVKTTANIKGIKPKNSSHHLVYFTISGNII